jgi:hypothetical protein
MSLEVKFVPEMTRKEAISKCHGIAYPEVFVQALEALGVIKTKEEEAKSRTYEQGFRDGMKLKNGVESTFAFMGYTMEKLIKIIKEYEERQPTKLFEHESVDGGAIRLETWPEGLVLWVNGKIKYKYWEDTDNQK